MKLKKAKQVLAIIGLCLIALMYILTIVFAVNKSPNTKGCLMAAIACTIIVPVIIYMFQLMTRNLVNTGHKTTEHETEEELQTEEEKNKADE